MRKFPLLLAVVATAVFVVSLVPVANARPVSGHDHNSAPAWSRAAQDHYQLTNGPGFINLKPNCQRTPVNVPEATPIILLLSGFIFLAVLGQTIPAAGNRTTVKR